jgi:hypothetical protein
MLCGWTTDAQEAPYSGLTGDQRATHPPASGPEGLRLVATSRYRGTPELSERENATLKRIVANKEVEIEGLKEASALILRTGAADW